MWLMKYLDDNGQYWLGPNKPFEIDPKCFQKVAMEYMYMFDRIFF